jgi:uncharacterized membrane protein YfcA
MIDTTTLGLILLILFLATLLRAIAGFGESVLAMPLLTLLVGVTTAVPIVALLAATLSVGLLVEQRRRVEWRAALRLIGWSLLGIPFGLLLLRAVPPSYGQRVVGTLLVAYGGYCLLGPRLPRVPATPWTALFGLLSGIIGGAYSTNGPVVVVYGTLQGWSPAQFHSTLQAYFLVTGLTIVLGHALTGLWTPLVLGVYLAALPGVGVGLWLGRRWRARLPVAHFQRLVYLLLVVLGLLIWLRA